MKRVIPVLLCLAFARAGGAEDPEEKAERRLAACQEVLVEVLGMPESIPRDLIARSNETQSDNPGTQS